MELFLVGSVAPKSARSRMRFPIGPVIIDELYPLLIVLLLNLFPRQLRFHGRILGQTPTKVQQRSWNNVSDPAPAARLEAAGGG